MNRAAHGLAALLATATLALGACGDPSQRVCVINDASGSTTFAQATYTKRLQATVERAAEEGGSVIAIVATGRPLAESNALLKDFDGLTGTERAGDREAAVSELLDDVGRQVRLAHTGEGAPTPGSGIVASLDLLDGRECTWIELYTDGLETSDLDVYDDDIVTERGRVALVDALERRGRLAKLDGVELVMPFGGYVPQGTELSEERLDALPDLWDLIAKRSGADLRWRR